MSGSTEYVADANRARIMRAIVDHGPLSRVEIAQVSGLSPATVTRNIAYLMTVGVLAEDTARVRTEGRSRIHVMVNASYGRIAIVGLTYRGATLYQYDMALEPCAEPISLGGDFAPADLPRVVAAHLSRSDAEFLRRFALRAFFTAMTPGTPSVASRTHSRAASRFPPSSSVRRTVRSTRSFTTSRRRRAITTCS